MAAASLLLLACGGEETSDRPAAIADAAPPAEPVAEPAQQPEAPPKPKPPASEPLKSRTGRVEKEIDPDGETVSLKGVDGAGGAFEARIGKNVEIPDYFPTDVPIFPNAAPMAAMKAEGHGSFVSFSSTESQEAIYDYYLEQLPTQGWLVDSENSFRGQLSITSTKDIRKVVVTIAGTEGDARVSVVITDEDDDQ